MDTVTGVLFILCKGGIKLKIIAWMGLVLSILNVMLNIIGIAKGKDGAGRIGNFVGTLVHSTLTYFFYIYLF
ncbi:hypothetical protein CF081_07780 [Clostridium botulinum]|nr:hypothetical protein CLQ_02061 [Clostridium botulinum Af84]MBN3351413.1 hypothetical protein [Clostridium botulinum]MBN3358691.1 hypothetical protein [Clostridium botulinum]MBN3365628.1 hypothetical protein [Clostridium botulinum]MBN3385877.1 hypothetical protein [Clostridium botulinum]